MLAAFALVALAEQASLSPLPELSALHSCSLALRRVLAKFFWPEADGKALAQKDLPQSSQPTELL